MANGGEWLATVGFLVRSADANWEGQGGRTTLRSNPFRDCLATVSIIDTMMLGSFAVMAITRVK